MEQRPENRFLRLSKLGLLGFCAALLVTFTGLVLYSVLMRYLFSSPPIWGEDVPKLLFVWLSFVGAGLAYMLGFNIRMTALVDLLPKRARRVNDLLVHVLALVLLQVIFWNTLPVLRLAAGGRMFSTGLSNVWLYLPLPLGCLLLSLNEVWRIVRLFRGGEDAPAEVPGASDERLH